MSLSQRDAESYLKLARVAWTRVLWPFIQWVLAQPNPIDALKQHKAATAGVAATVGGVAGAGVGGVAVVSAMGFWSGIGYWLGLVSLPLWGPILGGLLGAATIGGGVYVLLGRLSDGDRVRLATLYAHALNVLVYADGVQTAAEQDEIAKMRDRLLYMGLEATQVDALFAKAPTTADGFEFERDALEQEVVLAVLHEVWLAVLTARGAGEPERKALERLCARLGVADSADDIRQKAKTTYQSPTRRAPAIAVAAVYVAPPDFWPGAADLFDAVLDTDLTGNARARRAEIMRTGAALASAAAAIAAAATGHPEMLAIIAEG